MRKKQPAAPSRAAAFAHRTRAGLDAEIERLAVAHAVDEGSGAVFDALIDSWAAQESAVLRAAARAELAEYAVQADRLSDDLASIEGRLLEEKQRAEALKADLAHARATLRGRA